MKFKQNSVTSTFKRSFQRLFQHYGRTDKFVQFSGQEASDRIKELLSKEKPAMVCRFGSNELQCVVSYLHESKFLKNAQWYEHYHWNDILYNMSSFAGFFPAERSLLYQFSELMLEDMKLIDILGTWRKEEFYIQDRIARSISIRLKDIEPYHSSKPWTTVLEGKKVLVIHPFVHTIRSQYQKRPLLFENGAMLPAFDLITIQAVQSIAGTKTEFETWFDALDHMKKQIDAIDFDIALIGCGAYGFPLAAHVKRIGKKAVHVGGALQLMFGIMGKRWESNENILKLKNEHWVYPSRQESPDNKDIVEGGCYW